MKVREINKIKYVCSLGKSCFSASYFKHYTGKQMSYPFDWIFSNLDIVKYCIDDDFSTFLNKSYYSVIGLQQCNHLFFKEKFISNKIFFMHHNPYNNNDEYDYYVRCVNRFKSLLLKKEHKLFFVVYDNINKNDIESIKQTCIDFNNYFKNKTDNYNILCLIHMEGLHENTSHILCSIDNVDFIILYSSSVNIGTKFENNNDNLYLDKIIKNLYSFELI